MTEDANNGTDQKWLDCLHVVQSLSLEMNAALSALAGNDLQRFESSVAAQERLCDAARGVFQFLRQSSHPGVSPRELAATGRDLRQRGRVYAAVLTRSAQICGALLSLYQDSPRGYSRDGRVLPATHTWSCEV